MLRLRAKTHQRHEHEIKIRALVNEYLADVTLNHFNLEAKIAECNEAINVVAENVEQNTSDLGEMRHRLEFIEERMGI